MNATEATIWFVSTAVVILALVSIWALAGAHMLHRPHLRHRHPH